MANTPNNVLDVLRWGRAQKQGAGTAAATDRPTCADASIELPADQAHVFTRQDFPVDLKGGKNLVHLRIKAVGDRGQLALEGKPIEAGQLITMRDLFAGSFAYRPDATGAGWFDYEVFDGECYSAAPARVTMTAPGVVPEPDVMQLPSLRTAEPAPEPVVAAMMADPAPPPELTVVEDAIELVEPRPAARPEPEAIPVSRSEPTPTLGRRRVRWMNARPWTSRSMATRGSKVAGAGSRSWTRGQKTQSRLSSMRRTKGPLD